MMRIAVCVSYDGYPFCGWQSQPNGCGVQDKLEKAIECVASHPVRVHAAGRTDTGVHALNQVVHFDVQVQRPMTAWVRGVNANLPEAIRVEWAYEVSKDFHARFSAFSRSYEYWLYNAPVASAILANKVGWFHLPLSIAPMQAAAKYLVGEHDFSAFRASECQAKSPIKNLHIAQVQQFGQYFKFSFSASAFLHHQVRNMVGALVYIGKGAYGADYMATLLMQRDRTLSPPTFSPAGLYLTGVGYDKKWALPHTNSSTKSIQFTI